MKKSAIRREDKELIALAHKEFDKVLPRDWHGVSAAIRLKSGRVVTGLVLEAENPSLTVCAEPMVIGKALDLIMSDPITTIVAVRKREETSHKVIPPCGRCREFITDYAPDSFVIIWDEDEGKLLRMQAADLLPYKYKAIP